MIVYGVGDISRNSNHSMDIRPTCVVDHRKNVFGIGSDGFPNRELDRPTYQQLIRGILRPNLLDREQNLSRVMLIHNLTRAYQRRRNVGEIALTNGSLGDIRKNDKVY